MAPRHAPPFSTVREPVDAAGRADMLSGRSDAMNTSARTAPPDKRFCRILKGQLAAITSYFNPCGYLSLKRNYVRFAEAIRRLGVPLFTAELAFGNAPYFLAPSPTVVQFRTTDVLWHKERLLNLLLSHVPSEFDKIAWIDADLLFENPRWPEETERLLEESPVAQLFERAVWLDSSARSLLQRDGYAKVAVTHPRFPNVQFGHPGFAWAARRELLSNHGLLDNHIVGGGDMAMAAAMFGIWDFWELRCYSPALRQAVMNWMTRFFIDVQGQVGCVSGTVLHLWHGSRENRRYIGRYEPITRHEFDPVADIYAAEDGTWRWKGNKPELEKAVAEYFAQRREDSP